MARIVDVPSAARVRAACWPKVRHATKADALIETIVMLLNPSCLEPDALNVYACAACGGWHVGHSRILRRRVAAARSAVDFLPGETKSE